MKRFKATIKEKGMDGIIRTLRPELQHLLWAMGKDSTMIV